jgi:hypothetical protein
VLQVSTLVKQMKKSFRIPRFFSVFKNGLTRLERHVLAIQYLFPQIALSSPRLNCETLKSAAEGLWREFTSEAKSRNKHTTKNKPKAALTSSISAFD